MPNPSQDPPVSFAATGTTYPGPDHVKASLVPVQEQTGQGLCDPQASILSHGGCGKLGRYHLMAVNQLRTLQSPSRLFWGRVKARLGPGSGLSAPGPLLSCKKDLSHCQALACPQLHV